MTDAPPKAASPPAPPPPLWRRAQRVLLDFACGVLRTFVALCLFSFTSGAVLSAPVHAQYQLPTLTLRDVTTICFILMVAGLGIVFVYDLAHRMFAGFVTVMSMALLAIGIAVVSASVLARDPAPLPPPPPPPVAHTTAHVEALRDAAAFVTSLFTRR